MSDTLPFRFKLLYYLGSVDKTTPQETMKAMKDEYGQKKYFNLHEIDDHYLSMCANGIAEEIDVTLDENDCLVSTYRITDYGKELLDKYYPK